MKAIMVMFDTLNRHMLSPYGCDWTYTPNLACFSESTAMFNFTYAARREVHIGCYSFLYGSWSPLVGLFDDSVPQI